MKITVLGGGNGSFAAVADFIEAGHDVRWWRRNPEFFAEIVEAGGITVTDFKGSRNLPVVPTDDFAAAVDGADLIISPTLANAQEDLATRLAPLMQEGQVIYLPPGTFGSYLMMKIMRDAGMRV